MAFCLDMFIEFVDTYQENAETKVLVAGECGEHNLSIYSICDSIDPDKPQSNFRLVKMIYTFTDEENNIHQRNIIVTLSLVRENLSLTHANRLVGMTSSDIANVYDEEKTREYLTHFFNYNKIPRAILKTYLKSTTNIYM